MCSLKSHSFYILELCIHKKNCDQWCRDVFQDVYDPIPPEKKTLHKKHIYIYILSFAIIHMYQHLVICKPHSEEQRISPGSLATSPALLQKAMSNPQQCHQRTMPQVEQPKKKWHEVSKGAISWFKVTTFRLYLFHNKSGWDGRWFELTLLCKVSSNRFAAQQKQMLSFEIFPKKNPWFGNWGCNMYISKGIVKTFLLHTIMAISAVFVRLLGWGRSAHLPKKFLERDLESEFSCDISISRNK